MMIANTKNLAVRQMLMNGVVIIGVIVFSTSCIEFDKQVLTYKHDVNNDRLEIFQSYQGIYEGKEEGVSDEEVKQLNSVLEGERTFFFDNWIFEYNKASSQESLMKLPQQIESEKHEGKKGMMVKGLEFVPLLLDNITIENGDFYLGADNKLSAYQYVVVNNLSKVIKMANEVISLVIIAENTKDDKPKTKSVELILKAARAGYTWVAFDGNQIKVYCPVAKDDFIKAKKEFAQETANSEYSVTENSEIGSMVRKFLSNDLWVNYQNEIMEVTLGQPKDVTTTVTAVLDDHYSEDLLNWVKEKKLLKPASGETSLKEAFFK